MEMTRIYFVNIITGFLNVLNQLKELLMQNFVISSKWCMAYLDILKFKLYP